MCAWTSESSPSEASVGGEVPDDAGGEPEVGGDGYGEADGGEFAQRRVAVGVADEGGQVRGVRALAVEGDGEGEGLAGGLAQPGGEQVRGCGALRERGQRHGGRAQHGRGRVSPAGRSRPAPHRAPRRGLPASRARQVERGGPVTRSVRSGSGIASAGAAGVPFSHTESSQSGSGRGAACPAAAAARRPGRSAAAAPRTRTTGRPPRLSRRRPAAVRRRVAAGRCRRRGSARTGRLPRPSSRPPGRYVGGRGHQERALGRRGEQFLQTRRRRTRGRRRRRRRRRRAAVPGSSARAGR